MKILKLPLETRYQELKIKLTCENKDCRAQFEAEGKEDIRMHRYGSPESFTTPSFMPTVMCPFCKKLVELPRFARDDLDLLSYIQHSEPCYSSE